MRRYGVPEPYEKLKAFTRGQRVTQESMRVSMCTWQALDAYGCRLRLYGKVCCNGMVSCRPSGVVQVMG